MFYSSGRLGQNSNQLLEDLRRLNQIQNSPYQYDLELNTPNEKQSQITTKAGYSD